MHGKIINHSALLKDFDRPESAGAALKKVLPDIPWFLISPLHVMLEDFSLEELGVWRDL